MSPETAGILGIVILVLAFLLSLPVGFAMALVGLGGFCLLVSPAAGLGLLARDFFEIFSSYSLTVIPMFMFMGAIAFAGGMSSRLYDASHTLCGQWRGGLLFATVAGCMGFAAICGSTSATTAAMGRVALPEMKRYGYKDSLATGVVAASGSLGIMIPPSSIFIVYGILTEQSIGKLFLAGILPGILLAGLFMLVIAVRLKLNPTLAPPGQPATFREKLRSLNGVIEMLLLFVLVMGGLFLGWFSPMQAGSVGAAGALALGLIRRQLNWQGFKTAVAETIKVTCQVMVIVAGAVLFGHFIAVTGIPGKLADWVGDLPLPSWAVMAVLILLYLVGGFFMDALAMVTLTIPVIYPVVSTLGFDPIWFGVIIVLITEMGVITPPVGINVYVVKGIAQDVPLETIFKGVFPLIGAMIALAALLIIFPRIATFLPGLAGP